MSETMTRRDELYEAFNDGGTMRWNKPHLLRQIKAIDDENDKKIEAIRSEIHFLENTMTPELTAEQVVTRIKELLTRNE